jgi:hypothetical protein
MIPTVIAFKIAPLAPAYRNDEMMYCDKKNAAKNSRKENVVKNVPEELKSVKHQPDNQSN